MPARWQGTFGQARLQKRSVEQEAAERADYGTLS